MYLYSEIVILFAFNLNENVTFFLLACTELQSCVTELEGQRTKQPQPFVTVLF